jgi:hypothetical protein
VPSVSETPTPSAAPAPESIHVVINEIAWAGTATSSNDEWIELYNAGSEAVDISGWTLWAEDGTPKISISSGQISSYGYFLLERTSEDTVSDIQSDIIYTGALEDGGEILVLRSANNQEIDRVDAWHGGNKDQRASMERIDPLKSGIDASNWGTNNGIITTGLDASGNPLKGTPKYKNSVSQ